MPELSEIRVRINQIDGQLKPLLKERMDLAAEVAAAKEEASKQFGELPCIFVKEREDEILAAVDAGVHTKAVSHLLGEIMGISRRYQYHLLTESGSLCDTFGDYCPGEVCFLTLADGGKLTDALRIICRYQVSVWEANEKQIAVLAEDAKEMTELRVQLYREGLIIKA